MPLCRYTTDHAAEPRLGLINQREDTVHPLTGTSRSLRDALNGGATAETLRESVGDDPLPRDAVTFHPPVESPQNLIGIGLNYVCHAAERGVDLPKEPVFFAKSPSSITGPDTIVRKHLTVAELLYQGALGIVIGQTARRVTVDRAINHVFGYTVGNDVTAQDIQRSDLNEVNPWYRSKSMETFTPLGPWLAFADELDPANATIETRLNGEIVQSASTSDQVFDVAELLSYVSHYVTLTPGDVVLTGTPAGIGEMHPGDTISVSVSGIGMLRNEVAAA